MYPLVAAELLGLADPRDGSVLRAAALSASLSYEVTLRAGLHAGLGRGVARATGRLGSEFGHVMRALYLALPGSSDPHRRGPLDAGVSSR